MIEIPPINLSTIGDGESMWILCKLYIYVCVYLYEYACFIHICLYIYLSHILHIIYYIILHSIIYIYCFTHIFSQKNWHLQLTSWGPHQRAGGVLPHHGMEILQRGLQLVISSGHSNSFAVENPIQMGFQYFFNGKNMENQQLQ